MKIKRARRKTLKDILTNCAIFTQISEKSTLEPHLHALKNRHGTPNFWHRADDFKARGTPNFRLVKTEELTSQMKLQKHY